MSETIQEIRQKYSGPMRRRKLEEYRDNWQAKEAQEAAELEALVDRAVRIEAEIQRRKAEAAAAEEAIRNATQPKDAVTEAIKARLVQAGKLPGGKNE